jgi:hypothetical protein
MPVNLKQIFFNENNKVGSKTPTQILDVIIHNILSNPFDFDYTKELKHIDIELRKNYALNSLDFSHTHYSSLRTSNSPVHINCSESVYEKVLKVMNSFCLKKNVDFNIIVEKNEVESKSNHFEMITVPTITIEETVQKLFEKYILIYPYTSFYHYCKFIKNSSNNNMKKKNLLY